MTLLQLPDPVSAPFYHNTFLPHSRDDDQLLCQLDIHRFPEANRLQLNSCFIYDLGNLPGAIDRLQVVIKDNNHDYTTCTSPSHQPPSFPITQAPLFGIQRSPLSSNQARHLFSSSSFDILLLGWAAQTSHQQVIWVCYWITGAASSSSSSSSSAATPTYNSQPDRPLFNLCCLRAPHQNHDTVFCMESP